jgi:SET domain-containing protein
MSQVSKSRLRSRVLIEIGRSRISGVGVFAVRAIRRGQKIADGISNEDYQEFISWKDFKEFDRQTKEKIKAFCIGTRLGFIPPEDLDFNKLSVEWYMNHSCGGNVGFDLSGDFIALQNIQKGEELTYDYGLAESNPKFRMRFRCGSVNCRRVITGDDWRKKPFRSQKIANMLPALRSNEDKK